MAKNTPFPKEFRDDAVRIARNRDSGTTLDQVAQDLGIHVSTLGNWMRKADLDVQPPGCLSGDEARENRELRRRNKLLEQENEILRRAAAYFAQANLPGK